MYDSQAGLGPSHDDTPGYLAALTANGYVTDLPWKTYYLNTSLVMPSNSVYSGRGSIIVGSGLTSGGFAVSGSGGTIENANITGHSGSIDIVVTGQRAKILNTTHQGSCIYHIQVGTGSDYTSILNPTIIGSSSSVTQNAQIQVDSASKWTLENPSWLNTYDFGIQISAFSGANDGGTVLNPRCYNPVYTPVNQTGNGSQTVFTFIQPQLTLRNAVTVNGVIPVSGVTITTVNNITYTVTFSVAPVNGAVIGFRGWTSLECFNINGPVSNLSILGGDLNGSGDSGIVLADDFSHGSPSHVTVSGIKIRNMADAGIIEETTSVTYGDYSADISDCSQGAAVSDVDHSCAVTMSGTSGMWRGGVLSNTKSPALMSSGVVYQGSPAENGSLFKPVVIGNTAFIGTFTSHPFFIAQESTISIFGGVDLTAQPLLPYPGNVMVDLTASWTGVPSNSTFLAYSATVGTGWTRVTGTSTLNSTACLQTIASSEGAIVFPTSGGATTSQLVSGILEVNFWASVSSAGSGNPYCNVQLVVGGNTISLAGGPVVISGSAWKQYRVCIPTQGSDRVRLIAFGSTGTALASIDGISIGYRPYA